MIDMHVHVGRVFLGPAIRPSDLLKFMDANCIEKAVLLPVENPEETYFYVTTDQVLSICRRYPNRLIPFCNMDPRRANADAKTDFFGVLREYKEKGCKGFGEIICGLRVDDSRLQKIYEACAVLRFPIIFHLDDLRGLDEKGLPRYEEMLRKFRGTTFVGHGQHFWAEISGHVTVDQFGIYPEGKVKAGGAVPRLLSKYPNAYADLSASSGFNAISRDPQFGYWFLEQFQDKLLLGTDICHRVQTVKPFPIIDFLKKALKEGRISRSAYNKITSKNAERLLK